MYDQHRNGVSVEALKLGHTLPITSLTTPPSTKSALDTLRRVLTDCSGPAQRLRCACVGRKLRLDPAEDGVRNAVRVLWQCLFPDPLLLPPISPRKSDTCSASVAMSDLTPFAYSPSIDGLLTLPNGLHVYSHDRAPEETAFLCEEIFSRQVYAEAVRHLCPGDLVVDVGEIFSVFYITTNFSTNELFVVLGANIGMFALYATHSMKSMHASSTLPALQVVAVEPIRANYALLQRNLLHHAVRGRAYHCAVGSRDSYRDNSGVSVSEMVRMLDTVSDAREVKHVAHAMSETGKVCCDE